MNYLIVAILAYLLNAVSVTLDKILLVKRFPNPALYVFYISVFSLAVLFAVPFSKMPPPTVLLIASASTILWTLGAYFMFKALKSGEAIRVIPVIGTLIPIILLFMSSVSGSINLNEVWAIIFLLLGLIFLVFPYLQGKFSFLEVELELTSALFFANSYFLLKLAYEGSNFLSVLVYSRLILIPVIFATLIFPFLRKIVFSDSNLHTPAFLWSKTGVLLFIGQASGGISQLLLTFSISLASPAVINSIQGIQYVFLFILGLLFAKKFPSAFHQDLNQSHLAGKIVGIVLIFFGLWMLSFETLPQLKPKTGVTFSARYARELGLDPREVYENIINELNPEIIRLPLYWDEVEKNPNEFDFSQTEEFVKMAADSRTEIILVLGFKQPRWPECFRPDWTKNLQQDQFNSEIVELVQAEIEAFKKYPNILSWQVENEPFVNFGICPKPDKQRLLQEIQTVRKSDTRPIIITDSGELSGWMQTIKTGDIFGTTLYRRVWSPHFGLVSYPLPPIFYHIKSNAVKFITGSQSKKTMISELQAEPWTDDGSSIPETSLGKLTSLFPVKQLISNFVYAKQTRMDPILFWGVEWWYYMKEQGIPAYWQQARLIFDG
ncbi:DMT family transporter [Candidatus Daviesbacteria bacterium]|nr:DMT family transporter [Candidatus Daviesbacteria bacterium]